MKAPRLGHDRHPFECTGHQLAPVPRDPRLGKPRNRPVGDVNRPLDLVGEETEPGAEDDRDSGLELPQAAPDRRDRLAAQTSIPAIEALMNAARLPAIIARRPRRAMSGRRCGARPPIPPI